MYIKEVDGAIVTGWFVYKDDTVDSFIDSLAARSTALDELFLKLFFTQHRHQGVVYSNLGTHCCQVDQTS